MHFYFYLREKIMIDDNIKKDNFKRLSSSRLVNAHKQLKLLGNLSKKSQYEYSTREANEIVIGLLNSVKTLGDKFKVEVVQEVTPEKEVPLGQSPDGIPSQGWSDVKWAFEMLNRGEIDEAKTMLHRALVSREGGS